MIAWAKESTGFGGCGIALRMPQEEAERLAILVDGDEIPWLVRELVEALRAAKKAPTGDFGIISREDYD